MPTARPARSRKVLADGWYSWLIPSFRPLTDLLDQLPPRLQGLAWRVGPLRAMLLMLAGTRYDVLVVTRTDRGWRSLLLLRALLGRRRKLVVLHFIDLPARSRGLGGLLDRAWRPIDLWATRRAVLSAQVLSHWEQALYASRFGITPEHFRFIPFAWRTAPATEPPQATDRPDGASRELVVAAGRAFCDWPTLFEAADRGRWPLVVVCSGRDRALVDSLNADLRATVLTDISHEETRELLSQSAVAVLAMLESGVSQGQVRVRDAVDAGSAIVATQTRSLEGYVEDGITGVLVPAGDSGALGDAIGALVGSHSERDRLASAAARRAAAWIWQDYLAAIEAFAHGEPTVPPPGSVPAASRSTCNTRTAPSR